MSKDLLVSLIFLFGICSCKMIGHQDSGKKEKYGPIDVPDSRWRVGDLIPPNLEVPDSLGGNRLTGFIALAISVHKSGKLLGYKIRMIEVTIDTTKPTIVYSSVRSRSTQGDSLLRVFTPWIDKYYNDIKFTINRNDPALAVYDTASMLHHIQFNFSNKEK